MEHANTAFLMVAGMLFALMIMSLIAFVFSSLTTLPNEEDARTHSVQAAAFNEEYLAYDHVITFTFFVRHRVRLSRPGDLPP